MNTDNTKNMFLFDIQLFAEGDANETADTNVNEENIEDSTVDNSNEPSTDNAVASSDKQVDTDDNNGEQDSHVKEAGVPEQYDFTPTWGNEAQVDSVMLDKTAAMFKELNLTNEQANAVMGLAMEYGRGIAEKHNQSQLDHFENLAVEAKKELGKEFNSTVSIAAQGVELMEKEMPGLRSWLDESGLGNDVRLIRLFAKMGQLSQEDTGHLGKGKSVSGGNSLKERWKNSPEMFND